MIRSNDYVDKIGVSLKNVFKSFRDVLITTENTDIDKKLEKYKCIILLNHIPSNDFNRLINREIESVILNTGCYVIGNLKNRKYMVDVVDKMTQELYEGCDFDIETDTEIITYINYIYGYESNPDDNNTIYFSGILKTEIDFK
jgi:hypothetical protein